MDAHQLCILGLEKSIHVLVFGTSHITPSRGEINLPALQFVDYGAKYHDD